MLGFLAGATLKSSGHPATEQLMQEVQNIPKANRN